MLDAVWMAADEAGLDENQSGMVTEKVIWSVGEGLAPRSAVDTATTTLALPGMEAEALLKATREALLEATKPETGKAMEHGKPDGHGHDMAAEKAEEKAERAMEKAEKKAESAMETADEMEE
jgi:hypothetical protein